MLSRPTFENIAFEDRGQVKNKVMTNLQTREDAYDLCITSLADGINASFLGARVDFY